MQTYEVFKICFITVKIQIFFSRYHFNNELFRESQLVMEARWRLIVATAKAGDVTAARSMLGLSLAALQDFYSNSNWIELGNDDIKKDLGM